MTRKLADVAAYAGVSQSTVSRVLNDKPGIAESTRAAVLTALDVLGYERPTKLRGERARLVGVMLPELDSPIYPAFTEVVAGALAKRGFTPVLCTRSMDTFTEAQYVDILLEQAVSGVVFLGGHYQHNRGPHQPYQRIRDRSLPTVLVNAAAPNLQFPRVSCDDAHAVDQAYRHLSALGHTRIGLMLGSAGHVPSIRTLAAYRDLLPPGTPELVSHSNFTVEDGHAAAAHLLKQGTTALICANYTLAMGTMRAARRQGLSIPADISLVSYDDTSAMAHTDPPLTAIRQPIDAMGQSAVSLLLAQIEGHDVAADELLFEPELVVRASTGADSAA
jgi:DNA-binding LacI/PurR family transcriptional regulator